MPKVIKPKPGTYKGVQYRSQLEISWAKYMDKEGVEFRYVDESYYDFVIQGWDFRCMEVKPDQPDMVIEAMERWWGPRDAAEGVMAIVMAGNPPTRYGLPSLFCAVPTDHGSVMLCSSKFHSFFKRRSNDGVLAKLMPSLWHNCTCDSDLFISIADCLAWGDE